MIEEEFDDKTVLENRRRYCYMWREKWILMSAMWKRERKVTSYVMVFKVDLANGLTSSRRI